ncbi:MAG: hypothetical protein PHP14_02415 [Candidatus Pacebacteria bacterium]|nr:hypothetical protein [Candidatus Paceibacterota bacterium]
MQANFEIKPLLRAKNIKNAAQLVAYSFDYNVVIMELLPGKDVTKFSYSNVPEYSDRDIIQLIETVKELDQNDIVIDPKPSNFIYDEKNGFSVLDFHLKKTNNNSLPESIIDLSTVLTTGKYEDHILSRSDYEDPNYKEKLAKQTIE